MTDRPNRGAYPKRWRKGVAPLPPGIWPESTIHTHEAAQILGVDVRTIERLRARGMSPVQIASGTYHGRAIRYVAWELIVWRNKIIGEGSAAYASVWAWWMETRTDLAGPRPEPAPKPPGTPKGEQQRDTNRRLRRNLILRLAQAENQHVQRLFERVTA